MSHEVLLWAEYEDEEDGAMSITVQSGVVLTKSGGAYLVVRSVASRAGVDGFVGYKIKVAKTYLDDILNATRGLYPALIGRINDTLRSHEVVLDDEEAGAPGKKAESIDILLVGNVGSAEKAVGLKREGDDFLVCDKADNPTAIAAMEDMLTESGQIIPVDTQLIATLFKKKNARRGNVLAQRYRDMVKELLPQEAQE